MAAGEQYGKRRDALEKLLDQYIHFHPGKNRAQVTFTQVMAWLAGLELEEVRRDMTRIPDHLFSKMVH